VKKKPAILKVKSFNRVLRMNTWKVRQMRMAEIST
jgi:hypothetical protein